MTKKILAGKVAVVTGAARGIGAAIAERLGRDGATVVVNYSRSEKEAREVAKRIVSAGGVASVAKADMADLKQARGLVEGAVAEHGRLDILVNNAGAAAFVPLAAVEEDYYRQSFALNVGGPVFASKAAAAHLGSGGRIINVSSLAGSRPRNGMSIYSATKGALNALTKAWAAELGPKGITVNAVAPGPVVTDAYKAVVKEDLEKMFIAGTPLGRIGTSEDVAEVVAFLASPQAGWVTGAIIDTAGGFTS